MSGEERDTPPPAPVGYSEARMLAVEEAIRELREGMRTIQGSINALRDYTDGVRGLVVGRTTPGSLPPLVVRDDNTPVLLFPNAHQPGGHTPPPVVPAIASPEMSAQEASDEIYKWTVQDPE